MKATKRITAAVLSVLLLVCFVTAQAVVIEPDPPTIRNEKGHCNDTNAMAWSLTTDSNGETNTLKIYADADSDFYNTDHPEYRLMKDYNADGDYSDSPWKLVDKKGASAVFYQTLNVADGIEGIGTNAFRGENKLAYVTLPATLKTIGAGAFDGCTAVTIINYSGTKSQWESMTIGENNGILSKSFTELRAAGILKLVCDQTKHTVSAAFTSDADSHWHECTICGEKVEGTVQAHTYGAENVVKAPTCTEQGESTYTCTECGYVKTVYTEASGHDLSDVWDYNETEHFHKCKNCDHTADNEPHKFTEWTVENWPTLTEKGNEERHCTECGYKETRDIEFVTGDVNGDGKIDKTDAELIAKYNAGLITAADIKLAAADINGDGKIDILDCVKLMLIIKAKG